MSTNELDSLALGLNKALETHYFANLVCYTTWEKVVETGSPRTIIKALIEYMLPDLHGDIREEMKESK